MSEWPITEEMVCEKYRQARVEMMNSKEWSPLMEEGLALAKERDDHALMMAKACEIYARAMQPVIR